jgi:uncharacterized protein YbjT (DUF2867 family)
MRGHDPVRLSSGSGGEGSAESCPQQSSNVRVSIAGGHGKIALRLTRRLHDRGDEVVSLIRNPAHAAGVTQSGGLATICDLEQSSVAQVAAAIEGSDAVVFAAGAGPGSGAHRKLTVDRDGAIKLVRAAVSSGVPRYLMLSGAGVEDPPGGDEVFEVYLRAKAEADAAVQASDLEWTILRPGGLTEDEGTGSVRIESTPFSGPVPRDDVASVFARLLSDSRSASRIPVRELGTGTDRRGA